MADSSSWKGSVSSNNQPLCFTGHRLFEELREREDLAPLFSNNFTGPFARKNDIHANERGPNGRPTLVPLITFSLVYLRKSDAESHTAPCLRANIAEPWVPARDSRFSVHAPSARADFSLNRASRSCEPRVQQFQRSIKCRLHPFQFIFFLRRIKLATWISE